jgi:hypothetical protein
MRSLAGVSFFSAGLPKSPPNVEPLVVVEGPAAAPSFCPPSLGGPNRLVVVAGVVSFLSSGFVAGLFVVGPNNPPPVVPPVPPKAKLPVVGGTGVDVPEVSGFLAPNKPPPNAGVVVEVAVEVAVLSAGLGGSPKIPPVAGVVVAVDESPAGLGGPPNNPPGVGFAPGGPPNRLPEVAAKRDQFKQKFVHQGFVSTWFRGFLVLCGSRRSKQPSTKCRGGSRCYSVVSSGL